MTTWKRFGVNCTQVNCTEGWHNGFEATFDATHPNIFRLVEALHREQVLADAKYEQIIAGEGEPPAKKKKTYRYSAARLQALVLWYGRNTDDEDDDGTFSIMDYLRDIANNISYWRFLTSE